MVSVLVAYGKTARVQIAALSYFLIAGTLTQIPLFNYLGYEFSALMTIPAACISGILTIQFMREHRAKPLTKRTWLFVIIDYMIVNILLLLIPLILISFNAFAVKNCAYLKGLSYYLLLPVCAMFFSVSLALIVGILFRKAVTVYVIIVTAILSHIIFVTYTQPQLFAYNFILGFFPGITYDETMSDITPLIIYRQFTMIASLMMISLFVVLTGSFASTNTLSENITYAKKNLPKEKMLWGIVLFCLIVVGAGHLYRDVLGFEYSSQSIQQQLGRRSESDHFIFYYHNNDYSADQMQILKAESEFHYRKVAGVLKQDYPNLKKISIYIYPNAEWKQRFIGTTNTNIAKPWKREIHLTQATLKSTFRHELVHILASDFGFPVINASTRMGLNEGLAVAVDWDEGMFTPHQYAAALLRENRLTNTEQLFSYSGFAVQSSSYAYLVSGSFVRYLMDRFGIERFRLTFPNGNFVLPFGESLESLIKDWKAFLTTVDASGIPGETIKALFNQQSIFYKTCAREVAEQNKRASQAVRTKNYLQAENEFNASYENAPTTFALRGIFQTLNAQRKANDVIKRYEELSSSSLLKSNPAILMLLADSYYLERQQVTAQKLYRTIRDMNYSEPFTEAAALRLRFIADKVDPDIYYQIFYGGLEDSAKSAFIDSVIRIKSRVVSLLYVQSLIRKENTIDSSDNNMRTLTAAPSPDLQYFMDMRWADRLYSLKRFEEAKGMYWRAKNYAPTQALSDQLDENIELCDFIPMEIQ